MDEGLILSSGTWRVFTGNELGAILGILIWQEWIKDNARVDRSKVYMIASTVSSKMLKKVAEIEGFQFVETLTGFKWMGNKAKELTDVGGTVLFAFEEAIGYMVGGAGDGPTVLDKDGVSAATVFARHVTNMYGRGETIESYLTSMYEMYLHVLLIHRYGYFVTENSYYICNDPSLLNSIFNKIRFGRDIEGDVASLTFPATIGGVRITGVCDLTMGYDSSTLNKKPKLPFSKSSQMLTFTFENGAVITLRTSGLILGIYYRD
jgi:phosphomannomutase